MSTSEFIKLYNDLVNYYKQNNYNHISPDEEFVNSLKIKKKYKDIYL